jgi:hypothetical protein
MKLPYSIETDRNDRTLSQAAQVLNFIDDDVFSIKIRPSTQNSIADVERVSNAYVYPNEYKEIYHYLKPVETNYEGYVNGQAKKYVLNQNEEFLFIEHETGPEIITTLALIAASIPLLTAIVELTNTIIKTVSESNEKKKKGKESGRYYEAKTIVIEIRKKKKVKIIKVISLPVNSAQMSDKELLKFLKD